MTNEQLAHKIQVLTDRVERHREFYEQKARMIAHHSKQISALRARLVVLEDIPHEPASEKGHIHE